MKIVSEIKDIFIREKDDQHWIIPMTGGHSCVIFMPARLILEKDLDRIIAYLELMRENITKEKYIFIGMPNLSK